MEDAKLHKELEDQHKLDAEKRTIIRKAKQNEKRKGPNKNIEDGQKQSGSATKKNVLVWGRGINQNKSKKEEDASKNNDQGRKKRKLEEDAFKKRNEARLKDLRITMKRTRNKR